MLYFSLTIPHFFSNAFFPLFLHTISCTRWHQDKTHHNCVSWSYSQKVYQSHLALLLCQKITGKSGRGWVGPTQISSPEAASASGPQVTEPASLAVLLIHQKKRRDTCKAKLSPLSVSQPRSVVSERKSGCWRGWWHSTAVSICTTLGLQKSPWEPQGVWGYIKPGKALTMPWLDSSAARYFITGVILSASIISPKSAGLFTSLHLGIYL